MKDKMKLIPRIIMIIMLLVLGVGMAITIVDLVKEKSSAKKKVNDDGRFFAEGERLI